MPTPQPEPTPDPVPAPVADVTPQSLTTPAPVPAPAPTPAPVDSIEQPVAPAPPAVAFPVVPPPSEYPEDPLPPDPVMPPADPGMESSDFADEEDTEPSEEELAMDRFLDSSEGVFSGESAPRVAYWPSNDENSPEYAHTADLQAPVTFDLTPDDIERVFAANHFDPRGENDTIILGIRGSVFAAGGYDVERASSVMLTDIRPDHVHFKCTLGFYHRSEGLITLYAGSTVPCPAYMQSYYLRASGKRSSGTKCNLMPSGAYLSRVGGHKSNTIKPAIRTTSPASMSQDATVTVLRSQNDVAYGTQDYWDRCMPYDNIHCSYFLHRNSARGAYFSSAGCSTIRGRKDPSDQWAKFQSVLRTMGYGKRLDYVLLTGKEFAVAANNRTSGDSGQPESDLRRLRVGSVGAEVTQLQQNLGFQGQGYFGPSTKKALAEYQRDQNLSSDGIYSPALDQQLGWGIFA